MPRLLAFIALALALVACGGSPPIVQSSDLPAGFGSFSATMPWQIYPGIPQTDRVYYFEVYQGQDQRNEVGHITIVRYASAADADAARSAILEQVEVESQPAPVSNLGEQAVSTGPTPSWRNSDVLFMRCNTAVHVTMPIPVDALVSYAQKLDQKVTEALCR